jgi:excisionase family DNA binding protein
MNLSLYCSVAEACQLAGVSKGYLCAMIRDGRIEAEKIGNAYAVLRASVKNFERQPGMGRPTKKPASAPRGRGHAATRRKKPAK